MIDTSAFSSERDIRITDIDFACVWMDGFVEL